MTEALIDLPLEQKAVGSPTGLMDNSTPCTSAKRAPDDMALIEACREGDVSAFEQLVERYDGRLLRITQHVTHNREDAQDAVQEAFLKAFRKLGQFQGNSQFSTWLIRIAVNESLMKLRKRRSTIEVSIDKGSPSGEDLAAFDLASWAPNPEELYRGSELRNILRRALQGLRPSLRVVFVLRDVEELSTEQTAEVLELTQVAVRTRLSRARLQLRERLSKYFRYQMT